jgi:hypothetical protein
MSAYRFLLGAVVMSLAACAAAGSQETSGAGDPGGGAGPASQPPPAGPSASGGSDAGGGAASVYDGGAAVVSDDAGGGGTAEDGSADDAQGGGPRADIPAIACTDLIDDVYVTPSGLPAMTMGARGTIVRCAPDTPVDITDVISRLAADSVTGVTPTTGTTFYRIAYRTYREDGVPGVSTARVYLPMVPRSIPLPVVAVGHPTEGLAASCAPSLTPTDLDDLALPWAARGFAVIASDFAGLGNEGIQGYAANHDTAHSLLDSARALRAMLDPRALDEDVLLVGYSQGGGAVLAAQGLAGTYGAGGNVVAGVVFAAEYFSRLNSFSYVDMMQASTDLTIQTGISMPVVAAMRDYAYGYNLLGASNAAELFPASLQSGLSTAITTLCQTPFGGYLQGAAVHVGDIFDPTFSASFLSCVAGTSGCTGVGSGFYQYLQGDLIPPDPAGAPILYVLGLADVIMPPQTEGACNIGLLEDAGVPTQVCVDAPAMHTNITARDVGFAETWSEAKLDGAPLPTCSATGLPACQP